MQSTYNTISSQIAIQLKCHNYNSTYVHRTFSFESSLQDALLQIAEGTADDVLAGGIDEMTPNHLAITKRAGHWKKEPVNNLDMLKWNSPGSLAGEGASYFLISGNRTDKTYACIRNVKTLYKPSNPDEVGRRVNRMISDSGLSISDIDLVLLGINGDNRYDPIYYEFARSIFKGTPLSYYKHLCGEYHTASGFALWLAANILMRQTIPEIIRLGDNHREPVRNIIIYNQYYNINHSFLLLSA
jgi:3-oxoacyl-(acyl-carrier-protein) synthase